MSRRLPTLSGLQLDALCPGNGSLEHRRWLSERGALGSGMHEVQEFRIAGGGQREPTDEPETMARIVNRWAIEGEELVEFEHLSRAFRPDIPRGAYTEIPLGLFDDGRVERVEGGRGEYEARPGLICAGTIDVMWSEPGFELSDCEAPRVPADGVLWLADFKLSSYSPPIARNLQLRVGAMMVAKWTGATKVIPALCEMTPGPGTWDVGSALGEAELFAIELELREILKARAAEPPAFVVGPHCETCDARWACPAQVTEARALLALDPGEAFTEEQLQRAALFLPTARAAVRSLEDALKAHVRARGPLQLPSGKVYGLEVEEVESFDARAVHAALVAEIAEVLSFEAMSTTKGKVYDAIGTLHAALGIERGKKAAFERVRAAVAEAGGVTTETRERFGMRWPERGAAPALPEPLRLAVDAALAAEAEVPGLEVATSPVLAEPSPPALVFLAPNLPALPPCPVCGKYVRRTKSGAVRIHQAPMSALRCAGGGQKAGPRAGEKEAS